jgi:hypothetical protein
LTSPDSLYGHLKQSVEIVQQHQWSTLHLFDRKDKGTVSQADSSACLNFFETITTIIRI